MIMESTYLQHNGIKGQKWGVRNGPPYPISEGQHSAAEKRANPGIENSTPKRSVKEMSNQELREATDRQRLENEFIRQKYEEMKLAQGPQIQQGKNWLQKTADTMKSINVIAVNANSILKVFGFDVGKQIKMKLGITY